MKIKYCKLLVKLSQEITCNKRFVYIVVPYIMRRKEKNKYLIIKALMVINTIMGWFEITQYYDKHVVTIASLVENI